MSNPEIIKLWKEKAEIDYIPPFMSLWVSLDAWMKNRFNLSKDRDELEELKRSGSSLFNKFSELIDGDNINGILFRSYFAELHRALLNAHIPYQQETLIKQLVSNVVWLNIRAEIRDLNPYW